MLFTYANVLHKPPVNRFLFPLCHDLRALWPCWFSYNYLDPLWLAQIRRISRPKLRADFHPFLSVPNLAKYQKNVNLPHAHVQGFRIKKKKKKKTKWADGLSTTDGQWLCSCVDACAVSCVISKLSQKALCISGHEWCRWSEVPSGLTRAPLHLIHGRKITRIERKLHGSLIQLNTACSQATIFLFTVCGSKVFLARMNIFLLFGLWKMFG